MKLFAYSAVMSLLIVALYAQDGASYDHHNMHCTHDIQLQLADGLGFPVDGTQFWVSLDIVKQGPLVTIQLPVINFQTGQQTGSAGAIAPLIPGGYLVTTAGFLPTELQPQSLIPVSTIGASNNGMSSTFSFSQSPESLPVPPIGYIVQVTNGGELQIQGAGTFGNTIPPGPQTVMPCTISYLAKKTRSLRHNITLSAGATDTTQWTGGAYKAAGTGIRDTHII